MCSLFTLIFFSENRLYILGFDSHDVRSKVMAKCENFKIEISGDALFAHEDGLKS